MLADCWDKIPGVKILFGRWQDVLDQLECYDAIFFDTFGEYYDDLHAFNNHVPNILDGEGVYSYFNGLCNSLLTQAVPMLSCMTLAQEFASWT
jgi:type IV protein arginine methyltransferase